MDTGESQGSTKENTRRNEEIYRQKKKGSGIMEKGRQGNAEYKRLSIQRMTSKKISGPLCGTIYY